MIGVEIRYKMSGFQELRGSRSRPVLEAVGTALTSRSNSYLRKGHKGFVMASYQGSRKPQGRWQVKVIAASPYARRHNAKHNTLLRALGGQ